MIHRIFPGFPFAKSSKIAAPQILNHPAPTTGCGTPSTVGTEKTATVWPHVNLVLGWITAAAGVVVTLTFHSFRRGWVQHADGSGELAARWIFDRGTWYMCTTIKGYNYIFTTSKKEHMIGKILGGHDSQTDVALQELCSFDSYTRSAIVTCHNLQAVLDVLTLAMIRLYSLLKNLNAEPHAVKQTESCITEAVVELLALWSHLTNPKHSP
ncbi:Hypothetical protein PHPALM_17085 [Phytophthora palmivora]|uniref:Uncharacterized protein n=1 Tax=Phytophthora palmivora TaxID=4796 RepID=A0A2P4XN45_9STRA|nr:Hypothetical protein PHPALM_17085 [Phytophthora palmivora]